MVTPRLKDRIAPRAVMVVSSAAGMAAAVLILLLQTPEHRWQEGLVAATQVLLASVVAGFALMQIAATDSQTDVMQEQLRQAQLEASASHEEALHAQADVRRALAASVRQRLDEDAPEVVIRRLQTGSRAHPVLFEQMTGDVWSPEVPQARALLDIGQHQSFTVGFDVEIRLLNSHPGRVTYTDPETDRVVEVWVTPADDSRSKTQFFWSRTSSAGDALNRDPRPSDLDCTIEFVVTAATMATSQVHRLYGWVAPYEPNGHMLRFKGDQWFHLPGHAQVEPRRYPYLETVDGRVELGLSAASEPR